VTGGSSAGSALKVLSGLIGRVKALGLGPVPWRSAIHETSGIEV
jgi:hypothetical protein